MISLSITLYLLYKWLTTPADKSAKYLFFAIVTGWYTLGYGF